MTSACKSVPSEKTQLQRNVETNGMVSIIEPTDANAIVAIQILIKAGSSHDPVGKRGLHNLMMRTLRKGTQKYSEAEFNQALDRLGASIGTGTDRDNSSISLQCTQRHLAEALPLFFEILQHPTFPTAAIDTEKEQVQRDIKERGDQFLSKAFDLFQERYYGKYPYLHPLGTPEDVAGLTREDIVANYQSMFDPKQMIVSMVGPVDATDLRQQFSQLFPARPVETSRGASPLPDFLAPNRDSDNILHRETVANWVVLGYPAPSEKDLDEVAFDVMNGIMGGSMNSRLFTEVRDKQGLAYQIGSTYNKRQGPSFWAMYIGTKGPNFAKAKAACLKEVDRIQNTLVSAEELQNTKAYIKGTYLMAQERNLNRADLYNDCEYNGRSLDYVQNYPKLIDAISAEDVQRVAKKYLHPVVMGAVLPK